MIRETGTSRGSQKAEQSGPTIQISKADWDYERIARRAYELDVQRGRQDGGGLGGLVKGGAATDRRSR
jgi:hypothetical protein